MEFNEKLQELRRQKGLTQEELAAHLHVSRTAVSKWESGRGYPNIDSLKAIAVFFSVTVDTLLSGGEVLTIAEEEGRQKEGRLRDLVFASLDCSAILFLFLPLFGQKAEGAVHAVSLLALTSPAPYLLWAYALFVAGMILLGLLTLLLHDRPSLWAARKHAVSLLWNAAGALLFINSQQTYAATLLFFFLIVKALLLFKRP